MSHALITFLGRPPRKEVKDMMEDEEKLRNQIRQFLENLSENRL